MLELSKALGPLTKDFVWEYITSSSVSLLAIKSLVFYAANQLCYAFLNAIISVFVLLIYILLVIAKISVIIFPFVRILTKIIIEWHYTLSWRELTLEAITFIVAITLLVFKKKIKAFWVKLESSVSAKFRVVVRLAPHILFFTFAAIFAVLGQKLLIPFASLRMLPLISIFLPVVKTLIIMTVDDENQFNIYRKLRDQLLVWVVLGAYHAFATALTMIPFSSNFLKVLPYARELSLVILVWIQISPFFAKIVFDASLPAIQAIAARVPSSDFNAERSAGVISALKFVNAINESQEKFIKSLLQDGTALILSCFFLLLPTRLAYIGVVIVAFLFPIFRTYKHIYENDEIVTPRKLKPSEKDYIQSGQEHLRRWLRYWICLGVLWILKLYIIGLYPSVLLLISLWLQHSFFDGARTVFETTADVYTPLRERFDAVSSKRKISSEDIDVGIPPMVMDDICTPSPTKLE